MLWSVYVALCNVSRYVTKSRDMRESDLVREMFVRTVLVQSADMLYDRRCLQSVELFTGSSTIKDNSLFKRTTFWRPRQDGPLFCVKYVFEEMSIEGMAVNFCGLHIL